MPEFESPQHEQQAEYLERQCWNDYHDRTARAPVNYDDPTFDEVWLGIVIEDFGLEGAVSG